MGDLRANSGPMAGDVRSRPPRRLTGIGAVTNVGARRESDRAALVPEPRCDPLAMRLLRRTTNIMASAVGLALSSPVLGVIGILIALDSRGAPIYGSWRLTVGGRRFRCWKFRTMYMDSETRLARHLAQNPDARAEFEQFHKLAHDPRVTRVGHFLRATSLDELPQLVNVLSGEMSLVGPRPYLVQELVHTPEASDILAVKPGITGIWQVSGRNELTFRQRLRMERFYSHHRSLVWDAQILARTVGVVLNRRGAR